MILNCRAVTTMAWVAPCHDLVTSIAPECESALRCCCAFCATAVKCSPCQIPAACKDSVGLVKTSPFAVTNFKKPFTKDFRATTFKSPTDESCGSEKNSPQPLGNETFTRNILGRQFSLKTSLEPEAYKRWVVHADSWVRGL